MAEKHESIGGEREKMEEMILRILREREITDKHDSDKHDSADTDWDVEEWKTMTGTV
jgi:hypothetical protein